MKQVFLEHLKKIHNLPFDTEVVSSKIENGIISEGLYFTSDEADNGKNRIYCGFSRPADCAKKVPLAVHIHGGGSHGNEDISALVSAELNAACISVDWSGEFIPGAERYTFWRMANPNPYGASYLMEPDEKACSLFHIVIAIMRAVDFALSYEGIDGERIGITGCSWGGYLSLLLSGIDNRFKYAAAELGAGAFDINSFSAIGSPVFKLPETQRNKWLSLFDPYTYAHECEAKIFSFAASNDMFFWLGDLLKNCGAYKDCRYLIWENCDHWQGGEKGGFPASFEWMRHCMHGEQPFPSILNFKREGLNYSFKTQGENITSCKVLFSSGKAIWPARYWHKFPAYNKNGIWRVNLPDTFKGIGGIAYATVFQEKRAVSSELITIDGIAPENEPTALWNGGPLWDTAGGIIEWRDDHFIGTELSLDENDSITLRATAADGTFYAATNSVIAASGHASRYKGIRLKINGCGYSGRLTAALTKDYYSAKEKRFIKEIEYSEVSQIYDICFNEFICDNASGELSYPFDGLALGGKSPEKLPVKIEAIEYFN